MHNNRCNIWMIGYRWSLLAAVVAGAAIEGCATAQKLAHSALHTNEAYLDGLTRTITFATTDPTAQNRASRLDTNRAHLDGPMRTTTLATTGPVAVFAFVLDGLPDRVKVYPTGNYYYFSFIHNGSPYAGNIRLDTLNRDSGKVYFTYYADLAQRAAGEAEPDLLDVGIILDASHGVTIEHLDRLVHRVTYGRKSVVFTLNDLSGVKPPADTLGPNERFVGPIFDESGIRFFLVYNSNLRIFHYILDETVAVPDEFLPSRLTDRIVISKRTGFAFYQDHWLNRKILIGVFEGHRRANNYFDGPFDQLPDNFIEGETLRKIILEIEPSLKGQIDRLGRSLDYTWRYTIDPYLHYQKEDDLYIIDMCVTSSRFQPSLYYKCFTDDNSWSDAHPQPGALTKGSKNMDDNLFFPAGVIGDIPLGSRETGHTNSTKERG